MTFNNSEIPPLHGGPNANHSPAALLLWNSFLFGALICQVLLTALSEGFCEELYYVSRSGHSAPLLLFCLGCTDLVWCALWSPEISLSRMQTISSICLHIHMHMKNTHIHTYIQFSIVWSKLSAVMEDDHVRLSPLSHFLSWHYDQTWGPYCMWLLKNFCSGDEIQWASDEVTDFRWKMVTGLRCR